MRDVTIMRSLHELRAKDMARALLSLRSKPEVTEFCLTVNGVNNAPMSFFQDRQVRVVEIKLK
jgi:hypothetical protein